MDLKSGYPFWLVKNGLIQNYPALRENISCDVVIIGAGITGALVAYHLVEAGVDVVVVDRRDVATGSTSASTALLQYEVDTPLSDLIDMVGRDHAVRSYQLCLESIGKLARIVERLDDDCDWERKKSLYLASRRRDRKQLQREYEARRQIGIRLDFLERDDIEQRFPFSAPAALLSYDAAQVDAYRLTHALFQAARRSGLRVFDNTTISSYEQTDAGIVVTSDRGCRISARKAVFAAGYEAQAYLRRKVVTFRSTYALVSEPVDQFRGWGEDRCLIWESARPYIYLRTTADNRILIGGEDDASDSESARERRMPRKVDRLVERFGQMFPDQELDVAFSWAGTFGETRDGLAYIGETPEVPNAYFALGYGGNGITYSLIAAEIIRDLFCGKPNPDVEIFRFDR